MRIFLLAGLLLLSSVCTSENGNHSNVEREATEFFHHYISLFNQRLGQPDKSDRFRAEMSKLIHEPMLSAPLNGAPRMSESSASYARNLEAFVGLLEAKGVTRLEYQYTEIQVLTPNKVLANNLGRGFSESGDVLYETISIYFLYKNDDRWQIAMLNAYEVGNAFTLL